jgi:hypothetical protein
MSADNGTHDTSSVLPDSSNAISSAQQNKSSGLVLPLDVQLIALSFLAHRDLAHVLEVSRACRSIPSISFSYPAGTHTHPYAVFSCLQ